MLIHTFLPVPDMNNKIANTQYPVSDTVRNRWSPRSFSNDTISQEVLNTIFEAAGWAPSANNLQPWAYLYTTKADIQAFEKFKNCLVPGNQIWAQHADVLVISCAITAYGPEQTPNAYAWYDVGAANTTLIMEAHQNNIYGHIMGGFDRAKTAETFAFPEYVEPVAFIALGYLGEASQLEEPFYTREVTPRSRKTLSEYVFKNEF
ncbi:MAG: nitroreductase family protein [Siphonobacter sp.]